MVEELRAAVDEMRSTHEKDIAVLTELLARMQQDEPDTSELPLPDTIKLIDWFGEANGDKTAGIHKARCTSCTAEWWGTLGYIKEEGCENCNTNRTLEKRSASKT